MNKNKDNYARARLQALNSTPIGTLSTSVANLQSTVGGHTSKLNTIESGAEVNHTNAEIKAIIEAELGTTLADLISRLETLEGA